MNTMQDALNNYNHVRNFANRLCKMSSLSGEDVTQEVFIKVIKYLPSFKGQSSIRTWLLSITYNQFCQMLRSNKKHDHRPLDYFSEPSYHTADFESLDYDRHLVRTIYSQWKKMPAKHRKITWLFWMSEYTHREIAQRLNVPIGTVGVVIQRNRLNLKKILERISYA